MCQSKQAQAQLEFFFCVHSKTNLNNLFFLPLQLPIILNWSNQDGGLDWPIRKVRHWNNPAQFCDWGCYDAWCHIRLMNHCLFGHARAGWCCPLSGSQTPGVRGLSVTSRPSARLDVGGTDALRRATKWWLYFSGRHYLTRQELYIKLNSTIYTETGCQQKNVVAIVGKK